MQSFVTRVLGIFFTCTDEAAPPESIYASSSTMEYSNCEVTKIRNIRRYVPVGYAFEKTSSYAGIFDHQLQFLKESGVIRIILDRYEGGSQNCPDYRNLQSTCNCLNAMPASFPDIIRTEVSVVAWF